MKPQNTDIQANVYQEQVIMPNVVWLAILILMVLGKKINMALGYVFAVFLHGFYDSCCMIGTKEATAVFVIFVIAMYFIVFHMVKKASRKDRPV